VPGAVDEQRHLVAVGVDPEGLDAGPADHEVDVDRAVVDAVVVLLARGERVRLPDGDVAGGVLVEQRVEEDGVERADAALAVDERDLAEP
jgi:hypothetical protein